MTTLPPEPHADYTRLTPYERVVLSTRDAAILNTLRGIALALERIVRDDTGVHLTSAVERVAESLDAINACAHDMADQLEHQLAPTLEGIGAAIAEGVDR